MLVTVFVVEIALDDELLYLNDAVKLVDTLAIPTGYSAETPISTPTSIPWDNVKVDDSDVEYPTDNEVCISVLPPAKEHIEKKNNI